MVGSFITSADGRSATSFAFSSVALPWVSVLSPGWAKAKLLESANTVPKTCPDE